MPLTTLLPSQYRRILGQFWRAGSLVSLWLLAGLVVISRAQSGESLQLYINQVGDIAPDNPQREIMVTVVGPDGLPPEALSQVQINELELPALISPAFARDDSGPLRLVLAFDLSYDSDADWRAAAGVAQSLIDSLGPGDQLSLIRFHKEVEPEVLELDPTAPFDLAADPRFARLSDRTAFYQVVLAALKRLTAPAPDPAWQGRQAIIVITNVGDNTDSAEAEAARQAISQAQFIPTPVHIFSFSEKAPPNNAQFNEVAQATGGPPPIHSREATGLVDVLRNRIARLRWQYQLTFEPIYNPASADHPVTVEVIDTAGRRVMATSHYVFKARQPRLELSYPQWAYLHDSIEITAAAQMPFPVIAVNYQAPGQAHSRQETPPYRFRWTPDQLGPGVITAQAVDRAGNVSQPVSITLTIVRGPEPVVQLKHPFGQTLHLPIRADLPTAISQVELESAGGQVITLSQSPFDLWLQPGDLGYPTEPGVRLFHVRIYDQAHQLMQEETITVEFTEAPSFPTWVWPALSIGLMLMANFLVLPFLLAVWGDNYYAELLSRRATRKFWLKNRGNVPANFLIEVTARISGTLAFNLRQRLASGPPVLPESSRRPPPPASGGETQPAPPLQEVAGSQAGQRADFDSLGQAGQQLDRLGGGGTAAMTMAGSLSTVPILGPWLSHSTRTIRQWQTQLRGQSTGLPPNWARLRRLTTLFGGGGSPSEETAETPAKEQDRPREHTVPTQATSAPNPPAESTARVSETGWQQRPELATPVVAPGESLYFHLDLQPAQLDARPNNFAFEIHSRPLGINSKELVRPLIDSVSFAPRAWIYRYFHRLALLVFLGLIMADIVWFYTFLTIYLI